ncbi:hypothetical protein BU15DRAFT_64512 [Melanogaster broomeanus]|nr:hypothetical protein BU15DRAFT_64512 [Melanogaster broomeanus]
MAERLKVIRQQHELDEAVRKETASVLKKIPKRLFDTTTGILYSESTQKEKLPSLSGAFKSSAAYQKLQNCVESKAQAVTFSDVSRSVSHFYAYAMLSHRWGKDEPLLHHISSNVYTLSKPSGVGKLQWFCRTALAHKMRWAWSDTCCIDKSNSKDVQQSITSMFAWYRNSTVTLVCLPDVFKSTYDAIGMSEWFIRGWTLQELLAPRTIHFYKTDRAPFYADYRDFRKDSSMLETISRVTLIPRQYLTNFEPGMVNAKDKLRWMSFRETTVEVDKAYCLLGILGVIIPEAHAADSKWEAYARLMKEVSRKGHPDPAISEEDVNAVLNWLRHHTQRAKLDRGHLEQFVQSSQTPRSRYLFP